MTPYSLMLGVWLVWWLSWMAAAMWASPATARLSLRDEARHRVFMTAGVVLLLLPLGWLSALYVQLWVLPVAVDWLLVALAVLGFAFCWWARVHLGTLWSGTVTRKEGHRIVDTGPYGLVRHPIYTGILTAALATALLRGSVLAIAGFALIVVSLTIKARMEEQFLREQLGPDAYDGYRTRTPMLVPFWPVRRAP
jgi:protein-S-isoprenylcysteine O-methyltransferase Ste14